MTHVLLLGLVGGLVGADEAARVVIYERADTSDWMAWWALFLGLGYALGSIPFGYLLTRAAGLGDVRAIGSGNIGATNVLRTGHKGLAALTLALDALKGTAAVLIAALDRRHLCRARDRRRAACGPRRVSRASLSGLARFQGRQGRRHVYRRARRRVLAGRGGVLHPLARHGVPHALLLAFGRHRER